MFFFQLKFCTHFARFKNSVQTNNEKQILLYFMMQKKEKSFLGSFFEELGSSKSTIQSRKEALSVSPKKDAFIGTTLNFPLSNNYKTIINRKCFI